jgi:hypothetical protein
MRPSCLGTMYIDNAGKACLGQGKLVSNYQGGDALIEQKELTGARSRTAVCDKRVNP